MQTFFNPRSVAVVGASAKNLGNHVVLNLKTGFKGAIYPVNPNYPQIEGLTCYPSIDAIPGQLDLAIVIVPAQMIPTVLEACARKGTRRVIIESAGFSETGPEGRALQARCDQIARPAGIRLWGPNCMGVVDVRQQHFFTFMHPNIRREGLLPGRISLIVQSGMMSAIFLAELARRGIGVAKACSIGNRADVDECDLIEYLEQDPDTDVIALYLESILRGRRFTELAQGAKKPIVLLKGGQSQAGAKAAMSHTSSLAGNSRLLKSVLSQAGVAMADSIFQMMDMAHTLAMLPQLNPAGRVAIMTLSGGAGILACDALERGGLTIAPLAEQTRERLAEVFPAWMPPANPIDLFPAVAQRGRVVAFEKAFAAILADPDIDLIVIHYVAGIDAGVPDIQGMKSLADRNQKTVLFWLMGLAEGKRLVSETARNAGIAVFDDATRLAECVATAARFNARKAAAESEPPNAITPPSSAAAPLSVTSPLWDEFDSKQLLRDWRIPVVDERIAADAAQAWSFAQQVGLPVVLKGLAPGKAHKTEHGLVKLGLSDERQLAETFTALQRQMDGLGRILVQKQVAFEYELIAGFVRDDQFGACVMFGLGGIFAELEPDVVFALAPLDLAAALRLVRALRNRRLIEGFRSMTPLKQEVMAQLLVDLGRLGIAYPRIAQIDINPLVVRAGLPMAVDANVVLK
ncbi:MAG: acetate--CoA ligase family protein [Desulfobacterales bacterium]|nr:acetate--CoA ligase family protein [Desulfobacterales bacterium]